MRVHGAGRAATGGLVASVAMVLLGGCASAQPLLGSPATPVPQTIVGPPPTTQPTVPATAPSATPSAAIPSPTPAPVLPTSAVPALPTSTRAAPSPSPRKNPIQLGVSEDFLIKKRINGMIGVPVLLTGDKHESLSVTLMHTRTSGVTSTDALDGYSNLVGLEFTIKNVGKAAYFDSPATSAVAIDGAGKRSMAASGASNLSPPMPDLVDLAAGHSVTGWIAFELPSGRTLAAAQFQPSGGFATDAGDWLLEKL